MFCSSNSTRSALSSKHLKSRSPFSAHDSAYSFTKLYIAHDRSCCNISIRKRPGHTTVGLESQYSIPRYKDGRKVKWHTGAVVNSNSTFPIPLPSVNGHSFGHPCSRAAVHCNWRTRSTKSTLPIKIDSAIPDLESYLECVVAVCLGNEEEGRQDRLWGRFTYIFGKERHRQATRYGSQPCDTFIRITPSVLVRDAWTDDISSIEHAYVRLSLSLSGLLYSSACIPAHTVISYRSSHVRVSQKYEAALAGPQVKPRIIQIEIKT
ncbi:hypothetical protein R3P38DRAFT_1519659 [Favolaschia claudopus]|uniref:Uncharacterized protein n=1 Tax=Favolaschia claudopus TaxID=2862362 RepID=A0AAW0AK77_9AGAR